MPELPEVETMVRGLRPAMQGYRLRDVSVLDSFLLQEVTDPIEFVSKVRGAFVESVGRRGKWVEFTLLDPDGIIVIQPRMTGGFWLVSPKRPDHVRLTFRLDGPCETVWFCDNRRLGKIAWYAGKAEADAACSRSQGPDALVIAREELVEGLKKTDRPVKPTLMDQKLVAGIGNIYADEILFESRIHPERISSTLTSADVARIHKAIGRVLAAAIAAEGSTFDAGYRTVLGLEGGFLAQNAMYGHGGEPCRQCKTHVVKTRIKGLSGRPTHFCPTCQPLRPGKRRIGGSGGAAPPVK